MWELLSSNSTDCVSLSSAPQLKLLRPLQNKVAELEKELAASSARAEAVQQAAHVVAAAQTAQAAARAQFRECWHACGGATSEKAFVENPDNFHGCS